MDSLNHLLPAPSGRLAVSIIVPARDEARELQSSLAALAGQVDLTDRPLPRERWEVLLLINNSSDTSAQVAREFERAHPQLPLHILELSFPDSQAHIGNVRKLLMDTACERLVSHPGRTAAILSTDADTRPAPDWVAQTLAEIERGAEAVGGRIYLCARDVAALDPQTRAIQLIDERYRLLASWFEAQLDPLDFDPWPRHHQHFGGSLAIRPETYLQVGGLPPKQSLEDVAMFEQLQRHDIRFRHSPDVRVETSGRMDGRTDRGLAEQLTRWSEAESAVLVPSVIFLETLFTLRCRWRARWGQSSGKARLRPGKDGWCEYGLEPGEIEHALASKYFGQAWELLHMPRRVEERLGKAIAFEPVGSAVTRLQRRFEATQRELDPRVQAARSGIAGL